MRSQAAYIALAVACLSSAAGAISRQEEAALERAKILIEQRRPAEVLAILEPLLAANPELPGVRYQVALAAQMTGDSAKASSLATEAMQRKEETSELQVLLGVLAMRERKYSEAEKAFARAVELNPSNGIALYNLSEALREQARPKEAIKVLRRAKDIDPKRKLLALKMRLAQLEAGENVEDIEFEVLKRQGEEGQTEDWLMTAAAIHLRDGNYRQAIDTLRAAQGRMGLTQLRAILGEDQFFRQFAGDEQMPGLRQELGLE